MDSTTTSEPPSFALEPPTPLNQSTFNPHSDLYTELASFSNNPPYPTAIDMSPQPSRTGAIAMSSSLTSTSSSYQRHHPYSSSTSASSFGQSESQLPGQTRRTRSRTTTSAASSAGGFSPHSAPTDLGMELDPHQQLQFYSPSSIDEHEATLSLLEFSLPAVALAPSPNAPPLPPAPKSTKTEPKGKTSHARKTPPGHIKRPPNAFILFRSHCCAPHELADGEVEPPGTPSAQQLMELGITDHRHISRIVSHLWKSLSRGEKSYWERKAQEKKQQHQAEHPDYRYRPVYRDKDTVRRKKPTKTNDVEEEKRACEKLASELIECTSGWATQVSPEPLEDEDDEFGDDGRGTGKGRRGVAPGGVSTSVPPPPASILQTNESAATSGRPKWTISTVIDTLKSDQGIASVPPPPPIVRPKRVRPKRTQPKRKTPPKAPAPQSYLPPSSYGSCSNQYETYDQNGRLLMGTTFDYAPQQSHVYDGQNDNDANFNFVAKLEHIIAQQQQSELLRSVDPRHFDPSSAPPSAPSSRPRTPQDYNYSNELAHSARKAPPAPLELPYNPSFVSFPSQSNVTFAPEPIRRPLSPQTLAISQLQHYSIQTSKSGVAPSATNPGPTAHTPSSMPDPNSHLIVSPTSTTFCISGAGPGVTPAAAPPGRRESDLALRGMKRRGTLGRTNENGELMLISPLSGTFGARKFSLGRWELTKGAEAQHSHKDGGAHPLANEALMAYEADQEFLDMLGAQPLSDFAAQLEAISSGLPMPESSVLSRPGTATTSEYSESRPGTAASDVSDLDVRQDDPQTGNEYWRKHPDAATPTSQQHGEFHVGHQDFFLPPQPPLGTSSAPKMSSPFAYSVGTSPPSSQVPLFDSSNFGGSFQPFAHRQSIDAQLAAEAGTDKYYDHHMSSFVSPQLTSDHWIARRARGSDATMRGRNDSMVGKSQALAVLQEQMMNPERALGQSLEMDEDQQVEELGEAGPDERTYLYLNPDQAKDVNLVHEILSLGYGVSYDLDQEVQSQLNNSSLAGSPLS